MKESSPRHQLVSCNILSRRIFRPANICLWISLGALAGSVTAAEDEVSNLNRLVAAEQYQQAYELSLRLLDEREGEPEFDFLYGLAALETGRPSEAIFAFERIGYAYPDQQRVKLELARAYFMTNNYASSRQLFEEVLATNPAQNVQSNIRAFLDSITERENNIAGSLKWFVGSSIGSDSNINSATELGVISTPIGDVELSANGQSIDDNFADVGGGMVYVKPFSKTSSLNVNATYNQHNNFDNNDFDLDVLAADASYNRVIGLSRYTVGGRAQRVDLNGEQFQSSSSVLGSWQRSPGGGWSQALTGAFTTVRYDDGVNKNASLRDVNQVLVSGVLGKSVGNFNHSFSVYYGDESAQKAIGKNNAQQFYGLAFAEQYQLTSNHLPYFRISLHRSDNKKSDPIFSVEREDKTFSTSLGWIWRANGNINLTTDVTYTNNDSNIDLYEYDRVKFQTGLRYQF